MTTNHERRHFIDTSLETFTTTLDQLQLEPDLIPSYTKDTSAILDRLYVPNVTIGLDDTLRLETPEKYRSEEYLGIIALRAGETAYLDEHLTRPSPRQYDHMIRSLGNIDSPFTVNERIAGRNMVHREFATYLANNISTHQSAKVTPGGMRTLPQNMGNYTTFQKPLMIINMDVHDTLAPPSDLGHEMIHMHDWDSVGFTAKDDRSIEQDRRAWMENRGYYIGRLFNDTLAEVNPDLLFPSEDGREYTKAMDDVRAAFCISDGFTPTEHYYDEIAKHNLYDAIDIDFKIPVAPQEPTIILPPIELVSAGKKSLFRRFFRV